VDGKGGIKYTPVFEVGLQYVMQFNNELFALLVFAVQVKYHSKRTNVFLFAIHAPKKANCEQWSIKPLQF
jgi:hypothetical protein